MFSFPKSSNVPRKDRLEPRHIVIGVLAADIEFQRAGDRVVAFPCGKGPSAIPLYIHV